LRLKLLIHTENSNSTVKSEGTACGCVRRSKRNCTSRPDGPAGVQVRRGPFRFIRGRHEAASLSLSDPARRRVQGRAQASGRTARLAGPLHSKRAMLQHPRSLRPPRATLQAALSTVTVLLLAVADSGLGLGLGTSPVPVKPTRSPGSLAYASSSTLLGGLPLL
jgi:hypothetical protein